MQEHFAILGACPLFAGIETSELSALLGCLEAKTVRAAKNGVILLEGDPARYIGVVLTGGVQVVREDYYGNRSILARLAPGELFAESFACAGVPAMPVSVIAAADSAVLLLDCRRITAPCSRACTFHSKLIFNLLQVVARKNLAFHQRLEITARRTTREKLMAYLLAQAKQAGADHFTIPYDRQELADYLGVDRSGLSAELGKLRREGVLRCRKNEFTLL
ncbi:MAG: Crp/Fnr family transcriptional regulator [Butyricicoccus sp.]